MVQEINVSCKEFIETVFEGRQSDEVVCMTKPVGDTWYNFSSRSGEVKSPDSWYVCISTVRKPTEGYLSRKRSDLMWTYAIVLDDIGTKVDASAVLVQPSWVIETSEGNYQYGYLLEVTQEHDRVAAVIDALIDKGLSDPGAKGAYRVVRVPGSVHKTGFISRLIEWEPDTIFTLAEFMDEFGIDEDDLVIKKKRSRDDALGVHEGGSAPLINTHAGQRSLFPEDVEEILDALPGAWRDDYAQWVKVGAALFRLDRDDPNMRGFGFDLWQSWSAGGSYDGTACEDKWCLVVDTPDLEASPFTIGSLIKETGWKRSKEITHVEHDGETVAVDKDADLPMQLRKYVGEALALYGFNEDPVIWDSLLGAEPSCFVEGKGQKYFINARGDQVPVTPDREVGVMSQEFGDFLNFNVLSEHVTDRVEAEDANFSTSAKIKTFYRDVPRAVLNAFWSAITRCKIASSLQLQVDMFVDKVVPNFSMGKCTFSIPFRGFGGVDTVYEQECVDDYLVHNPMLDELVAFVVMSRFASNRKNCFLWLHADSDWGKGFLFSKSGVLGGLGIVQSMSVKEIEMALEGKPLGLDKYALVNSWVLHVDEFKTVNAEIKMLEDGITASPKNMLRFEAPVFAKVFTSAEGVDALTGEAGVEEQFARRFSYVRMKGRLSDREVHKRWGMFIYTASVRRYVQEMMEEQVAEMRSLGVVGAARRAELWLGRFHDRYGLGQSFDALSDTVEDVAVEIARGIRKFVSGMFDNEYADMRDRAVYLKSMLGWPDKFLRHLSENCEVCYRGDEQCVVVAQINALCGVWLSEKFSYSESKKMGYKRAQIAARVDELIYPDRKGKNTRVWDTEGVSKAVKGSVLPK